MNLALSLGYGVCALIALLCAIRLSWGDGRRYWSAVAGLLLALAIARSLGAQGPVPNHLREMLVESGLYPDRQPIQIAAIGLCAAAVIGALVLFFSRRGRRAPDHSPAVSACLGALLVFIVARASSLHRLDAFFGAPGGAGLTRSEMIEATLLLLLGASLVAALAQRRSQAFAADTRHGTEGEPLGELRGTLFEEI